MAGPNIPPQGGGTPDAVDLAFDTEELDSGASQDTVQKETAEAGAGAEVSMQAEHLFQRVALDSVDFIGATRVPGNAVLVRKADNGYIAALWQAGSTGSPTGIVFAYSADGGATWSAPAQALALNDPFVPAAVINQVTGDIHVVSAKRGLPAIDGTADVRYKVLTWNGVGWTLTGTLYTVEPVTTTSSSNISLAVDNNGFLVAAYTRRQSDGKVFLRTAKSNGTWNLITATLTSSFEEDPGVELRCKILNVDDVVGRKWLIVTEQNGNFKLRASGTVLSASVHAVVWTLQHTIFKGVTEEFDLTHIQTALSGTAGLVLRDGSRVVFFTWVPDPLASSVLGPEKFLEGDASNPCRYPAVLGDGQEFIAVYARQVTVDNHQVIYSRSTNTGGTWGLDRHPLDEDSGGNHWGWFKLPFDVAGWDMVPVLYCENALTPYDVIFGQVAVEIARSVIDSGVASETRVVGPFRDDSAVATEALAAGEAKAAADAGIGAELFGQDRNAAEAATAAEVLTLPSVLATEQGVGAEVLSPGQQAADSGVGAETKLVSEQQLGPVPDSGAGEELLHSDPTVVDQGVGEDTVPEADFGVLDAGTGQEAVVPGPEVQEAGAGADEPLAVNQVPAADSGVGAETVEQKTDTVQDSGVGAESFPAMDRTVVELARAVETFISAPPDLFASVYDDVSAHTEFVTRLATGLWTSASEQPQGVHRLQKVYHFRGVSGLEDVLFRRRKTDPGGLGAPGTWGPLERSEDLGATWTAVLSNCADVAFGPDGIGYAIATGGDSRVRRVYRSSDTGETWVEVYADPTFSNGLFTSYQRIAVDPFDGGHVALVGHEAGDSTSALVFTVTGDGFATAPVRRSDPLAGIYLFRSTVLGCGYGGRWVWGVTPDFLTDIRNRVFWSSDDGGTWIQSFDQRSTGVNSPWQTILFDAGAGRWFLGHNSAEAAVLKSTTNAESWTLIDVNFVEDPDDPGATLNVVGAFPLEAMTYDAETDTLFLGSASSDFPVIAAINPQTDLVWTNLKKNLAAVVVPIGETEANSTKCSVEGLVLVQPVGGVQLGMSDLATADEVLTTLRSVLDSATAAETFDMVKEILESGAVDEVFQVLHAVADAATADEALQVLLTVLDLGTGEEDLAKVVQVWLAVRVLMHKGVARVSLEGPAGPAVPWFPPEGGPLS